MTGMLLLLPKEKLLILRILLAIRMPHVSLLLLLLLLLPLLELLLLLPRQKLFKFFVLISLHGRRLCSLHVGLAHLSEIQWLSLSMKRYREV